jgi:Ca2+-binding EF-hand superfamily protein
MRSRSPAQALDQLTHTNSIRKAAQHFFMMDRDRDGALTPAELQSALAAQHLLLDDKQVQRLLQLVDDDGSKTVDVAEFLRHCHSFGGWGHAASDAQWREPPDTYVPSDDAERSRLRVHPGLQREAARVALAFPELVSRALPQSASSAAQLFRALDTDQDGVVSVAQVSEALRSNLLKAMPPTQLAVGTAAGSAASDAAAAPSASGDSVAGSARAAASVAADADAFARLARAADVNGDGYLSRADVRTLLDVLRSAGGGALAPSSGHGLAGTGPRAVGPVAAVDIAPADAGDVCVSFRGRHSSAAAGSGDEGAPIEGAVGGAASTSPRHYRLHPVLAAARHTVADGAAAARSMSGPVPIGARVAAAAGEEGGAEARLRAGLEGRRSGAGWAGSRSAAASGDHSELLAGGAAAVPSYPDSLGREDTRHAGPSSTGSFYQERPSLAATTLPAIGVTSRSAGSAGAGGGHIAGAGGFANLSSPQRRRVRALDEMAPGYGRRAEPAGLTPFWKQQTSDVTEALPGSPSYATAGERHFRKSVE